MKTILTALIFAFGTQAFALDQCDSKVIEAERAWGTQLEVLIPIVQKEFKKVDEERKAGKNPDTKAVREALKSVAIESLKYCSVYKSVYKQQESCLLAHNDILDGPKNIQMCDEMADDLEKLEKAR